MLNRMEAHIGQRKSASSARPSISEIHIDKISEEEKPNDHSDSPVERAEIHEIRPRTSDETLATPQSGVTLQSSATSGRVRGPIRANTLSFDNQSTPKNPRSLNEILLGNPYKDIRRCSDSMTKNFGISPRSSPPQMKKQSFAECDKRDSLTRMLRAKLSDSPNLFKRAGRSGWMSRQETVRICDDELESSSAFFQDQDEYV